MSAEPQAAFGDYVLVRPLGAGGTAESFVAQRMGLGVAEQLVCLKRIHERIGADDGFRDRFVREAQIAAKLRHSNVVGIVDYGEVETQPYMALELVDGLDLRTLLAHQPAGRLTPDLALVVTVDLAYALSYAHGLVGGGIAGIMHRDLCPANVFISRSGEVKLADFGIAKAIGAGTLITGTQTVMGNAAYMAPELGTDADVDGRADLYSLGAVTYEALCGQKPFSGVNDVEVLMKARKGERDPIAARVPGLPPVFAAAIERLLNPEVGARFATAEELIVALAKMRFLPIHRQSLGQAVRDVMSHTASSTGVRLDEEFDKIGGPAASRTGAAEVDVDAIRRSIATHFPVTRSGVDPRELEGAGRREGVESRQMPPPSTPPPAMSPSTPPPTGGAPVEAKPAVNTTARYGAITPHDIPDVLARAQSARDQPTLLTARPRSPWRVRLAAAALALSIAGLITVVLIRRSQRAAERQQELAATTEVEAPPAELPLLPALPGREFVGGDAVPNPEPAFAVDAPTRSTRVRRRERAGAESAADSRAAPPTPSAMTAPVTTPAPRTSALGTSTPAAPPESVAMDSMTSSGLRRPGGGGARRTAPMASVMSSAMSARASTPTTNADLHPEVTKIRVRVEISGASSAPIYLNGRTIGVTAPQTLELDPGNYRLGVGRGGMVERTRTLQLRAGQAPRTIRFEL